MAYNFSVLSCCIPEQLLYTSANAISSYVNSSGERGCSAEISCFLGSLRRTQVHSGFWEGAKQHIPDIKDLVQQQNRQAGRRLPVWITGHSLGGGYANCMMLHLLANKQTSELFSAGELASLACSFLCNANYMMLHLIVNKQTSELSFAGRTSELSLLLCKGCANCVMLRLLADKKTSGLISASKTPEFVSAETLAVCMQYLCCCNKQNLDFFSATETSQPVSAGTLAVCTSSLFAVACTQPRSKRAVASAALLWCTSAAQHRLAGRCSHETCLCYLVQQHVYLNSMAACSLFVKTQEHDKSYTIERD